MCSASAREWARTPQIRRAQKRKPAGDSTRWLDREIHQDKYVNNLRKGFRHQLKLAFNGYDSLTAESTPAATEAACSRLRDQFKRLYYLDVLDIMIVKDKQSGEDTIFRMTTSQVARNQDFRREEKAPRVQVGKKGQWL